MLRDQMHHICPAVLPDASPSLPSQFTKIHTTYKYRKGMVRTQGHADVLLSTLLVERMSFWPCLAHSVHPRPCALPAQVVGYYAFPLHLRPTEVESSLVRV